MTYFISCEGKTEYWYFEWLNKQINVDPRTKRKVNFSFKNVMPSAFAKSNNGTFTKSRIAGSSFCRVQDIEDYSDEQIKKFNRLLKSTKEASQLHKKIKFEIGYSNFTFEVWIIAHKAKVKPITDRALYFQEVNKAFNTNFISNADYKHERNFKTLLSALSLNDIIYHAIPECKRFVSLSYNSNPALKREIYGYKYIQTNPDTTLHNFVEKILNYAGLV